MTNGDWIRSMTDEQLAEFLDRLIDSPCIYCRNGDGISCDMPDNGYDCLRERLAWLKQEHKGDGND